MIEEGEAQSGGRLSKGNAATRAIMALEHAGFVKHNNLYGLDALWYGRADEESSADKAVEILLKRSKFVICDMPDLSKKDMLRQNVDASKPCLSNKSGNVYVLFDIDNGAVML